MPFRPSLQSTIEFPATLGRRLFVRLLVRVPTRRLPPQSGLSRLAPTIPAFFSSVQALMPFIQTKALAVLSVIRSFGLDRLCLS